MPSRVEIHGSRAVPLKEKCKISWNRLFFRVLMLPRRYVRFCKIGSMERQKRITFKKSLSKNIYLWRRYVIFKSKKVCNFPTNPGYFQWEINANWKSRKSITIDFPLVMSRILRKFHRFFLLSTFWLLSRKKSWDLRNLKSGQNFVHIDG